MFTNSSPEGTGEKHKLIPPEINISVHLNEENIRKPSSRHGQLAALPQQKKKTAIKWVFNRRYLFHSHVPAHPRLAKALRAFVISS